MLGDKFCKQLVFQFIPEVLDGAEVSALCGPELAHHGDAEHND